MCSLCYFAPSSMYIRFRTELAAREHMMDHGQLSPPTPAPLSRAPSLGESARGNRNNVLAGLKMSKMDNGALTPPNEPEWPSSRKPSLSGSLSGALKMTSLSMVDPFSSISVPVGDARRQDHSELANESALDDSEEDDETDQRAESTSEGDVEPMPTSPLPPPPILLSPSEISAQLPTSLAALRRSSLLAALRTSTSSSTHTSRSNSLGQTTPPILPILLNPACSGYFVEPVSAV